MIFGSLCCNQSLDRFQSCSICFQSVFQFLFHLGFMADLTSKPQQDTLEKLQALPAPLGALSAGPGKTVPWGMVTVQAINH